MGQLCSCARAQRAWEGTASPHNVFMLRKPTHPPEKNNSPYMLAPIRPKPVIKYSPQPSIGSGSSLNESGISSQASSAFEGSHYHSASAPSTPQVMIRRKPPPKPPRMRANLSSNVSPQPPQDNSIASAQSAAIQTLKSSLVDVTNTLDRTFSASSNGREPLGCSETESKLSHAIGQIKEVLLYEIDPDVMLPYLRQHGAINSYTESEVRRIKSKHGKSELLLDVIFRKGHDEFTTLCKALRLVAREHYLADLMEVLIILLNIIKSEHSTAPPGARYDNQVSCPCKVKESDEASSFDIDIAYLDIETSELYAVRDIAEMKKAKSELKPASTEESMVLKNKADKYIPVISVSLYSQCLFRGGVDALVKILQNYQCLRELCLGKNHMEPDGLCRIGDSLRKNESLFKLDIRMNHIGENEARRLAEGLRRNCTLKILNLASTELCDDACAQLMQGISWNHFIAELDVGFNELGDPGMYVISEILANNASLRKLRMRANQMSSHGAYRLFKALKKNSRLSFLDLSSNKVGNESLATLAEALLLNRTLRELNLENCQISTDGCAALARALKTNTVLKYLDLSLNPIADSGVEALSEGLKYNQILETLCLNMCGIRNYGFLRLLDNLQFNMTMTTLKLCYNSIGENGVANVTNGDVTMMNTDAGSITVDELYERLCFILQQNKDLKVLLWGNSLDTSQQLNSHMVF